MEHDKSYIPYLQSTGEHDASSFFKKEHIPLPKGFIEPTSGPDYFPGEPTPMNPYDYDDTKRHQYEMYTALDTLVTDKAAPIGTPAGIVAMVEENFLSSRHVLSASNHASYHEWLSKNEELTLDQAKVMEKAAKGEAPPSDLLGLLIHTGLESAELGKVTHPYGHRLEYVPALRNRINLAITEHGGVMYPAVLAYRDIKLHPYYSFSDENYHNDQALNHELHGLVATYKHDLGHIDIDERRRIKIVERQTAGIRIDKASGFDQNVASKLHRFKLRNDNEWRQKLVAETGCLEYIDTMIQKDSSDEYLIPLSTVIYAYENERINEQSTPARELSKHAMNISGMLYVNRHAAE